MLDRRTFIGILGAAAVAPAAALPSVPLSGVMSIEELSGIYLRWSLLDYANRGAHRGLSFCARSEYRSISTSRSVRQPLSGAASESPHATDGDVRGILS